MPLEGSAPLSQNPEGNTAAAISDVNDKRIIAQERGERIKVLLLLFNKQRTEAADAIKAVTASYSYKPERSHFRGQAGAAIASKNSGKAGFIPTAPSKIPLVNAHPRYNSWGGGTLTMELINYLA